MRTYSKPIEKMIAWLMSSGMSRNQAILHLAS